MRMRYILWTALALAPCCTWGDDLAKYDARVTADDRAHWAFQPVKRPELPKVNRASWCRNPIDRFVLAKLEEKRWSPNATASPLALLRRVHFDLTGLPPTIAEQDAFLRDPSPEALDRVVDDLLARPAHGERWARHWLDAVRFAESNGFERDATKPSAWRYRDWVIRALNSDMPYNRFLLEQIAGDELPDATADTLIATGFNRLGPWDDEPADPKQDRFDQLDDVVATTSEVFLGLTLGCARCHDHKFEPLTSVDYTRLVAVFAPLERPQEGRTELDVPIGPRAEVEAIIARDGRIEGLQRSIRQIRDGAGGPDIGAEDQVAIEWHEGQIRREHEQTPDLPRGYFLRESSPSAPVTNLLARGQATSPGPVVAPGVPAVLASTQPRFLEPDSHTTRRRLSLARWLARPDHPLTARVIVNRVWQFHCGDGLVRTPSDFGTAADPPTHPELLDWLADWFVNEGEWSLKRLHRLILESNTSRMAKTRRPDYAVIDPDDQLLWRMPYRRLEVEAIRDAILSASGRLNLKMFGPSMFPTVPRGALEATSDPDKIWRASSEEEASRRTIYAFVKRSMVIPLIEVLDFCDTTRSSPRRLVTSTATQALALFNGEFVAQQSGHFADRLMREAAGDPAAQVVRAYRLALGRPPQPGELDAMTEFLESETRAAAGENPNAARVAYAQRKALARMARVVFNLNEFAYPD